MILLGVLKSVDVLVLILVDEHLRAGNSYRSGHGRPVDVDGLYA